MSIEVNRRPKSDAKFSYEEAEAIRMAYRVNPKASYRELARQYGVSKTLIGKIVKYQIYKPETYERGEENEGE